MGSWKEIMFKGPLKPTPFYDYKSNLFKPSHFQTNAWAVRLPLCFCPKTFLTSLLNFIPTDKITFTSSKPLYSYSFLQSRYLSNEKRFHRLKQNINFSMVPEIFFESQKKILQSENAFSDNRKIYPQHTSTWEIRIHHTWNEVFEDNFYYTDASQIPKYK